MKVVLLVILSMAAVQLRSALSLTSPSHSLSPASHARSFLRSYIESPPQQDQLAELNQKNPEAYALVQALLSKRSFGLPNPRHPTASAPRTVVQQEQQHNEWTSVKRQDYQGRVYSIERLSGKRCATFNGW